ncbi:hypothetical protein ACQ4WX_08370 [Streptomyces lasalocidi]
MLTADYPADDTARRQQSDAVGVLAPGVEACAEVGGELACTGRDVTPADLG